MSVLLPGCLLHSWVSRLPPCISPPRGSYGRQRPRSQRSSLLRPVARPPAPSAPLAAGRVLVTRTILALSRSSLPGGEGRAAGWARCASVSSSGLTAPDAALEDEEDGEEELEDEEGDEDDEAEGEGTGVRPGLVFTAKAGELKAAVGRVMSAINRRALANPILDHVLLEAEAKGEGEGAPQWATAMATDGLVAIKCSLPLDRVISSGRTAVRAKTLYDFLSQEPSAAGVQVSALQGGAGVAIACGRATRAVLRGEPAEDFPAMPRVAPAVKMVLPRGLLRDALLRTRFAAARDDEGRQNLNSVLLSLGEGRATLVGTDGRLFACLDCTPSKVDSTFSGSFLLPLRAVDEICRLIGNAPRGASKKAQVAAAARDSEEVTVELQRERIAVQLMDGSTVGSQLIMGAYPDVMPLLQQQPQVEVGADREELLSHLRKVALFAGRPGEKAGLGAVHLALQPGSLTLSASSGGVGEYEASLEVDYGGLPVNIAFNPSLLMEVIQHTAGDPVLLGFSKQGVSGMAILREPEATFVLGALMDSS